MVELCLAQVLNNFTRKFPIFRAREDNLAHFFTDEKLMAGVENPHESKYHLNYLIEHQLEHNQVT